MSRSYNTIRVGNSNSARGREYHLETTIVHPDFTNSGCHYDDIALMRTSQDIEMDHSSVMPICLPPKHHDSALYEKCVVAGWGLTSYGGYFG